MIDFYTLASTRRSIRRFTAEDVPEKDIEDCIRTAATAPSGCNSQCWRFVAVRNRDVLARMADAATAKADKLMDALGAAAEPEYIESKKKMLTFFAKAPVCIAVFMTELEYYDTKMTDLWLSQGHTADQMMALYGHPDLLSVGAAIQNLLLAFHEKGYGACWMNDPVIAGPAINDILGVDRKYPLISLIPVGRPSYNPRAKALKPIDDIFSIID